MIGDNKRGQGLSINAIILIVLGVIVLVVLIAGFTLGWSNIKDLIAPSNNVAKIASACSTACSLQNEYDYCTFARELKASDLGALDGKGSCNLFATSADYDKYGVAECPGLCPDQGNTVNQPPVNPSVAP